MDKENLIFIGVIIVGVILLAIVMAFIVSSKFRKDVIAGEGEAAILGLINVKGVIIVLLTGIFGGIFVYLIQLDVGSNSPHEHTVDEIVAYIKNPKNNISFKIPSKNNITYVVLEKDTLYEQTIDTAKVLSLRAFDSKNSKWSVVDKASNTYGILKPVSPRLANRSFDHPDGAEILEGEIKTKKSIKFDIPYHFNECNLTYKIDTVFKETIADIAKFKYKIVFGEFRDKESSLTDIKWGDEISVYNSNNGEYSRKNIELRSADWKFIYYVSVGVGNPTKKNIDTLTGETGDYYKVDYFNLSVFQIGF